MKKISIFVLVALLSSAAFCQQNASSTQLLGNWKLQKLTDKDNVFIDINNPALTKQTMKEAIKKEKAEANPNTPSLWTEADDSTLSEMYQVEMEATKNMYLTFKSDFTYATNIFIHEETGGYSCSPNSIELRDDKELSNRKMDIVSVNNASLVLRDNTTTFYFTKKTSK